MPLRRLVPLLAVLGALAGCAGDDGAAGARLRVVATTTQAADLVRNVGGDRVHVEALIPPNADPHDFEPRPSDARAVARARLIVRSGGEIDAWLGDLLDSAGGEAERITLIDAVRAIRVAHDHGHGDGDEHEDDDGAGEEHDDGHGHREGTADTGDRGAPADADPHWWQDPRNAVLAVERIRAALAAADPAGARAYAANARRYAARIRRLDAAIARCLAAIPRERRVLVTAHAAFDSFAHRYDVRLLGSILPGLSSNAQPSAGDLRRLVDAIRRAGVTTIFPESALSQRLEQAVARDAGVRVGPPLHADALGEPGTPGGTYLGALREDAAAIARGFGGRCRLPAA
jgi:ABC-type Zn uptake system ZnuABC Zn-binding protein ZnuA